MTLLDEFGNIDIYVFDQLLRGRIGPGVSVFDAGCGGGRNLVYLLRQGFDVCGNSVDPNADGGGERDGCGRLRRTRVPTFASSQSRRRRFLTPTPTS